MSEENRRENVNAKRTEKKIKERKHRKDRPREIRGEMLGK